MEMRRRVLVVSLASMTLRRIGSWLILVMIISIAMMMNTTEKVSSGLHYGVSVEALQTEVKAYADTGQPILAILKFKVTNTGLANVFEQINMSSDVSAGVLSITISPSEFYLSRDESLIVIAYVIVDRSVEMPGNIVVCVTARILNDPTASSSSGSCAIVVLNAPPSDAPRVVSIPTQNTTIGTNFTYQVIANNTDNDNLTYFTNIGSINSTGFFSITPMSPGIYDITIIADDNRTQISTTFVLFVTNIGNRIITVDDDGGKDYTKIQDAVNAASPGDTVYVYNGTYNEQVTISKSISLVGESNQSTTIRGTSAYGAIYVTASYVNISNIKMDNSYYGIYLGCSVGVYVCYSSNDNITGNTITNCINDGIYLWGGNSNNSISGNTVTNCTNGITLYSSSNNNVVDNTVTNCGYGGIFIYGSNNSVIGNTVTNCSGGISICPTSNNNVVAGNTLDQGISMNSSSAATVTLQNNTVCGKPLYFARNNNSTASPTYIENSTYGQVILYNCSGFVIRNNNFNRAALLILSSSNNNITGNTIANRSSGIRLDSSSNNDIIGNTVTNCSHYAIFLCSNSKNNIITGNTVANCSDGIYLDYSANNNISSNTITSCGKGIYLYNSNSIVTGNAVTNCGEYGVYLYLGSHLTIAHNTIINTTYGIWAVGSGNTVTDNTITNCRQFGIWFTPCSSTSILGNTITNCDRDGIRQSGGGGNDICGNIITNCGVFGIAFIPSWNNKIHNNTITNCSDDGICIGSGSYNNNVTSNNIYGNKYGLYISGGNSTAYNNWWGSSSGPYNAASNPNGTGNRISDGAPFSPWATSPFNNQKPTATILSIAPNPAIYKQSVITFTGSGNDTDGTIVEYLWESNISGIISRSATFTNNSLPVGNHTITFRVKDNNDTWSEPVSTTLTINTSGGNVSITEKPGEQKKGFIPFLDFNMIIICIIILASIAKFRRRKQA
jgi:parallel beta-helix repeat protein